MRKNFSEQLKDIDSQSIKPPDATLPKSEKTPQQPKVGDTLIIASNYGRVLVLVDIHGNFSTESTFVGCQTLGAGVIVEEILDGGTLVVKSTIPNSKSRYQIEFNRKVRIAPNK